MALDWAIWHDIPHGGWCPKGRKAEDGSCVCQVQQKGDRVRVGKRVRLIHKRSGRARLRQPELRRERAPTLAPGQSNRFVNKPSHLL